MHRSSIVMGLFLFPVLASAADEKPSGPIKAEEVREGWLALFDGATSFGWRIDGQARVENRQLVLGGSKATRADLPGTFGDYDLRLEYRCSAKDANKEVAMTWNKKANGSFIILPQAAGAGEQALWGKLALKVEPRKSSWQANLGDRRNGANPFLGSRDVGPSSFTIFVPAGHVVALRNVRLKPAGLKSVFNGKNLEGWKEFPDRKSRFAVTEEGWLSLKNGPGDLQTTGKWADFVLQIDCFCAGDFLNSGVFFRCQRDKYQQGYEAQIHNKFSAKPEKVYTLEEHDPVTHKLIGKKKVKYQAVDYGTGGVYRRQPARQQVAKDNEWFVMTIVANDRHLAAWVNGIQVTDWTDNRPTSDNARNGCRLEAGPISLQGHDKTTNLRFRGIRIAELPKPVKNNEK